MNSSFSITKAGTYFRYINVYFDQLHHDVTNLGGSPFVAELDDCQFLQKNDFENHLVIYLEGNNSNIGWLASISPNDIDKDFDAYICSFELKQTMDYINFHYQIAHINNKKPGSHDDFECYVGSHSFPLYYHLLLSEDPNFPHFTIPKLPC